MRVLAVDPGQATGLALYEACGQGLALPERFEAWVCNDPMAAIDRVRLETVEGLDAVVVEGFTISGPRARDANLTIEIIGALRWICHKRDVPFVVQQPGEGQRFAGPKWEKLRRLGWYRSGPDHARSAAAHLLLYLVKEGAIDACRVIPSTQEVE